MRLFLVIFTLFVWHWSAMAQGVENVPANMTPIDSSPHKTDSLITSPDTIHAKINWIEALKQKKFNPESDTIHYPRLVKWTWFTVKNVKKAINNYDTTYVKSFGKKLKISLKGNTWFDNYDYRIEGAKIRFYSTSTSSIGAYVSLFGISIGYQLAFDRIKGVRPRSRKFDIGFTCARFSVEFYKMRNTGDMNITIDKGNSGKERFFKFNGLVRNSWGINAYYFFNNTKYAPSAAYNNSLQQRRNAGSFFCGLSISNQRFSFDPKLLPPEVLEDEGISGTTEEETWFNYTDYSVAGGYGYNWILGKHFLINTTLMIYTGIKYAHAGAESERSSTLWAVNGRPRVGIAYNSNRFFASLQGSINSHFFNTGEYRFRDTLFDFSLIMGIQF